MSRQEDFKRMAHSHDTESSKYEQQCYIDGAEDGYEYAVDKACEWLMNNVNDYIINDIYLGGDWYKVKSEMFYDFRKSMEE